MAVGGQGLDGKKKEQSSSGTEECVCQISSTYGLGTNTELITVLEINKTKKAED